MLGKSGTRRLTTVLLLLTVSIAAGCEPRSQGVTFIRVGSGPAGGNWYPLGAKIAQLLEAGIDSVSTSSLPGGGETNVMDVNRGNAELAFTYSSAAYAGYEGRGHYPEPQTNIRHFATLYPATLQAAVPASSDIDSYADLGSRNLSPGQIGLTSTLIAQEVLATYGITFESVRQSGGTVHHVDFADSGALLKDGHVDAFLGVTSVPQASFMELTFQPGIRFLSIEPEKVEQILTANPSLIASSIPEGSYPGVDADILTVGAVTTMVVNKDLPDELVYRMTKVFWESHAELLSVTPSWEEVRLEDALRAVTIPVHPGAQRYYDEHGVVPKVR
jgi:uncharacterized protein